MPRYATYSEQSRRDQEAQVLVVEDAVLVGVVALVATPEEWMAQDIGLDGAVTGCSVSRRQHSVEMARLKLGEHRAKGSRRGDVDYDTQHQCQAEHRRRSSWVGMP